MNKIFVLFIPFLLAACAYSTYYVNPSREVYPPLTTNDVAISAQKRISTPHKEIGRVAVIEWGDGDAALEKLREMAAKIGGNLIIDLKVEKTFGGVAASGLAVLLYQQ